MGKGVSLPAVMKPLGYTSPDMALLYLHMTRSAARVSPRSLLPMPLGTETVNRRRFTQCLYKSPARDFAFLKLPISQNFDNILRRRREALRM
jgi:hypothetical protein